jgi:hypothetical protein
VLELDPARIRGQFGNRGEVSFIRRSLARKTSIDVGPRVVDTRRYCVDRRPVD